MRRHQPLHVTLRVRSGLPTLRQKRAYRAIHRAFVTGCDQFGLRLVHYSVQNNHLHLLVEAPDAQALARALQGLSIRLARSLNRVFGRRGGLFADRYHARALGSPREVRNALRYVLSNGRRHGVRQATWFDGWLDPFSSGVWFDGWRAARGAPPALFGWADARAAPLGADDPRFVEGALPETVPPQSYLLQRGWRQHGLIDVDAKPRSERIERATPRARPKAERRRAGASSQGSRRR